MEKEIVLAAIIGPFLLVYGLSIFLYPRQWKKLVAWLERDHFAYLPMAMLLLIFGLVLVNSYNIWEWSVYIIISLTGWALLVKGVFYFLAPGSWITAVLRWKAHAHLSLYYLAGAVLSLMGATLVWCGYFRG